MYLSPREQLIAQELPKIEQRIAEKRAALATVIGQGDWVVYTGGTDCPVYVTFNENLTGITFNIGLTRATRFKSRLTAMRLAREVRNGNNERGNVMRDREAHEVDIANLEHLHRLLSAEIPAGVKLKIAA
jgi:hypothetical protein